MKTLIAGYMCCMSFVVLAHPRDDSWQWAIIGSAPKSPSSVIASLNSPKLLEWRESERVWNHAHPLVPLYESERPRYWDRPPSPEKREKYAASIRDYQNTMSRWGFSAGNATILLDGKLSPETAVEYLYTVAGSERNWKLQLAAAVFVLVNRPGDPKRVVSATMPRDNGTVDEYAGKRFGNWQAGYISYIVGVSEEDALEAARYVQMYQDRSNILKGLEKCFFCAEDLLDHRFGQDDYPGRTTFLLGRDFAFRKSYREFMESGVRPPPSASVNRNEANRRGNQNRSNPQRDRPWERSTRDKEQTPSNSNKSESPRESSPSTTPTGERSKPTKPETTPKREKPPAREKPMPPKSVPKRIILG